MTIDVKKPRTEAPSAPEVHPSQCAARGCPMAGSIRGGKTSGGTWCAYHYSCAPNDIGRVTSVLNQHANLRDIVNQGRRLLANPDMHVSIEAEEKRLRIAFEACGYQLDAQGLMFRQWLYRVESMLGGYVVEAMKTLHQRARGEA